MASVALDVVVFVCSCQWVKYVGCEDVHGWMMGLMDEVFWGVMCGSGLGFTHHPYVLPLDYLPAGTSPEILP